MGREQFRGERCALLRGMGMNFLDEIGPAGYQRHLPLAWKALFQLSYSTM